MYVKDILNIKHGLKTEMVNIMAFISTLLLSPYSFFNSKKEKINDGRCQ